MAFFAAPALVLYLLAATVPSVTAWEDLELLDLVEEIPQNFYHFLSVEQEASAAEIKKAYRRMSLMLHPDKNKEQDAETQFRQLVAIYEVLKDEERRRRYDNILLNGLPDWRQPVFYYRRVRKMSNCELAVLLFFILTVGHYAVIWSMYLDKQLDELLCKKKKEKKRKSISKPAEDLKSPNQDRIERVQDRPQWQDILPLKLSIWIYVSLRNLPQMVQEMKNFYEEQRLLEQQQREEEAEAAQEAVIREKRPKTKKAKLDFPVYQTSSETACLQGYEQTASIEEIEEQMDSWLKESQDTRKKAADWSEEELSLLSRLMVKFPGGTPGRWEKIAHELGRSVSEVTSKVKQMKDNVSLTPGLVKLSELLLPVTSISAAECTPTQMGTWDYDGPQKEETVVRCRNRKSCSTAVADGGEVKVRSRRQRDFDPALEEQQETEQQEIIAKVEYKQTREKGESTAWTQNQQKLLELALQQFPRGTAERWDRIARVVPGRTKEECINRYRVLAELVQRRKQNL